MANLGDNNTPVEGESFGLPSGFSIDENSGNLAIRDTNGNVVAEWDETNAQWDFANNTLNNVGALNSDSVSTEEAVTTYSTHGYHYTISGSTDELYVVDRRGELVLGGAEEIGVSDSGDFGEILQETINSIQNGPCSIKLSADGDVKLKSTADINHVFSLWGNGKNRTKIGYDDSFSGTNGIQVIDPEDPFIGRLDSIKWDNWDDASDPPENHIHFDGLHEWQLHHCEFRDGPNVELLNGQASGEGRWNIMFDCWFLASTGFLIESQRDARLIGNRIVGAPCTIRDSERIIRRGNDIDDGLLNLENVEFQRPDEEFGNVGARSVSDDYNYAGDYDGSSPDARLDDAISTASAGDTIYLENATYSSNRTISKRLTIIGSGAQSSDGSAINAAWTLDGVVTLKNVTRGGDDFELAAENVGCYLDGLYLFASDPVTISRDNVRYLNSFGGDVTFADGTSGGLIDSCVNATVTDNGTNTIGNIG